MKQPINQAKLFWNIRVKNISQLLAIVDEDGEEVAQYFLPAGSYLIVAMIKQVLKLVISWLKFLVKLQESKDITGGLPRIAELFEARMPKDAAIIV